VPGADAPPAPIPFRTEKATKVVGALIGNRIVFEAPPVGAGFKTETKAVPGSEISAAVMDAVSCELLTNTVVLGFPFHNTVAPVTKPLPFTVNVNAAPPGTADVGLSFCCKNGTGLFAPNTEELAALKKKAIANNARKVLILGTPFGFARVRLC